MNDGAPTGAGRRPDETAAAHPIEAVLNIAVSARISLTLIALGFAVLFLPQGVDVVRGLVEDTNQHVFGAAVDLPSGGRLIFQWVAFVLACMWTGLNAWYWPRVLFRQRVAGPTPHWFKVVLRISGLVPLIAAIIALLRVADTPTGFRLGDVWIGLIVLVIALVLLAALFARREAIFADPDGWFMKPSAILDRRTRRRAGRDPRLHRGDDAFFLVSLGLGLVMVLLLSLAGVRTWVAQAIGSAALAFGAIGILIAFLSTIAWAFGRMRMPVLPVAAGVFLLCGFLNDNHAVRTLAPVADRPAPIGMEEALRLWEARNPDGPLILVAAAGGASRAGYWTSAVLRELDRRTEGAFGQHVFAISAVSGGSLGAVGYAARLADTGGAARCHDPAADLDFDKAFVGGDYLSPAVGGLLYPDLVQRFLPLPIFPDRAGSVEESWEVGWRRAARATAAPGRCAPLPVSNRMAEDYDAIWRGSLRTGAAGWVPLVLVNGTLVENGKRVITAPVRIENFIFEDSYDLRDLIDRPIRGSTAILNGARSPLVSPAGTLRGSRPHGRIIDGGYFENGGLETMLDLARFLRLRLRGGRQIVLVEIDNSQPEDTGEVLADLQRYPNHASDAGLLATALAVEKPPQSGAPALSEITSIVGGLYGTRTSRGVLAAKRLSGLQTNGLSQNVTRVTFNLPRLGNGAALSWTLSAQSRAGIDQVLAPGSAEAPPVAARIDAVLTACQRAVADQLAALLTRRAQAAAPCPPGSRVAAAVGLPM